MKRCGCPTLLMICLLYSLARSLFLSLTHSQTSLVVAEKPSFYPNRVKLCLSTSGYWLWSEKMADFASTHKFHVEPSLYIYYVYFASLLLFVECVVWFAAATKIGEELWIYKIHERLCPNFDIDSTHNRHSQAYMRWTYIINLCQVSLAFLSSGKCVIVSVLS